MTNVNRARALAVLAGIVVLAVMSWQVRVARAEQQRRTREVLFNEIRPVALANCSLKRFGSRYDGGYLMCENLLEGIESAYSYGIDKEDNWGCDVSRLLRVPVHQYDCFTPHRPVCAGGTFVYHNECVGARHETIERRLFDSVVNQLRKNGDTGKRVLVKMDIEGAELPALMNTPDEELARVAQLPMELHGNDERFLELVRKLKRTFYVVSVHVNNFTCTPEAAPLPGRAFQVLFVNKKLGMLDPSGRPHRPGTPPDAPDNPKGRDCQPVF
jgi:hypothetical protein